MDLFDAFSSDKPKTSVPPENLAAASKVNELLENLNEQQRQAVVHSGGPELIIAGAGSGKTRVLTHRIAYLLATGQASVGEILAITFTNKAAAEMRERVVDLIGPRARRMWVSTFHSACVRILREHYALAGLRSTFGIYDAQDSRRLLTMIMKDLGMDSKKIKPQFVAAQISNLKNELITPQGYLHGNNFDNAQDEAIANIYVEYNRRLHAANSVDFDDLIMVTEKMLRDNPAVAENYQRRFRHILVDEYQDTNHAQYRLIRALMGREIEGLAPANLTVVGDSDQSIYAFRGATIRNIEEFEKDFPNATTILLEQNYRSTQNILSAANAVISKNQGRRPKRLWTDSGAGAPIILNAADDQVEEARQVVRELDDLAAQGAKWGEVAIFYRTNAQSRVLEEMLIKAGIPYRIVGGTRFYERQEIKDALAYLQVIANPDDEIALRRIINTPRRGLGDKAVGTLAAQAAVRGISLGAAIGEIVGKTDSEVVGLSAAAKKSLREFWGMIQELQSFATADGSPAVILEQVLTRSGYLAQLRASKDPQDATRVENLAELATVVADFMVLYELVKGVEQEIDQDAVISGAAQDSEDKAGDAFGVFPTWEPAGEINRLSPSAEAALRGAAVDETLSGQNPLSAFLERVSLVADADQVPNQDDSTGQVTLMTVHTAKGLEFSYVFVTGMEDGTFPHSRSLENAAELAEERRLAYVAITRARKQLFLTRSASRSTWGAPQEFPASRFLADIPEELVEHHFRSERELLRETLGFGSSFDTDFSTGSYFGVTGSRKSGTRSGGSIYTSPEEARFNSANLTYGSSGVQMQAKRPGSARPIERLGAKTNQNKPTLDLQVGDRVQHGMWGIGTVVSLEGKDRSRIALVQFENQTKRLLLRSAPLKKLD